MKTISTSHKDTNIIKKGLLASTIIILLVIVKDLSHSYLRSYSFYLSESLLFSIFWVLFAPTLLLIRKMKHVVTAYYFPPIMTLLHIALFSALVFSISTMFYEYPFEFFKTFLNTITRYGIVCLLIYSTHLFFLSQKETPLKTAIKETVAEKMIVTYRNTSVIIAYSDIVCISSEKPYIAIVTKEKTYLHTSTLKRFLEEKTSTNFIQIHKSTIVNTNAIVSYTSRKNGDYDVLLSNQKTVRASRNYSQKFKPYFDHLTMG